MGDINMMVEVNIMDLRVWLELLEAGMDYSVEEMIQAVVDNYEEELESVTEEE